MLRALIILCFVASTAIAGPSVTQLAKDRAAAAEKAYKAADSALKVGRGSVEMVGEWSERWMGAAIDAGTAKKQALADHAARMLALESELTKDVQAGKASPAQLEAATFFRIEADYWVAGGKR
jgi:hypothetical protein